MPRFLVKPLRALLLVLAILVAPLHAHAGPPPIVLAVLPFENLTGNPALDPIGRGLEAMLVTDLGVSERVRIVERSNLRAVLAEQELQRGAFVDPATAVRAGRGVGAAAVVTGSLVGWGTELRIDARLVSVETGEVLLSVPVAGPSRDFFLLEKSLATSVLADLGLTLTERESLRLHQVATESVDAFVGWSEGLAAVDRNDPTAAATALSAALRADGNFNAARVLLDELRARLTRADAARAETFAGAVATTVRLIAAEDRRGLARHLETLNAADGSSHVSVRDACTIARSILDASALRDVRFESSDDGLLTAEEWALATYAMCGTLFGQREQALATGTLFVERYPASRLMRDVRPIIDDLLAQMDPPKQRLAELERYREIARGSALLAHCTADHRTRCVLHDTFTHHARLLTCQEAVAIGERHTCPRGTSSLDCVDGTAFSRAEAWAEVANALEWPRRTDGTSEWVHVQRHLYERATTLATALHLDAPTDPLAVESLLAIQRQLGGRRGRPNEETADVAELWDLLGLMHRSFPEECHRATVDEQRPEVFAPCAERVAARVRSKPPRTVLPDDPDAAWAALWEPYEDGYPERSRDLAREATRRWPDVPQLWYALFDLDLVQSAHADLLADLDRAPPGLSEERTKAYRAHAGYIERIPMRLESTIEETMRARMQMLNLHQLAAESALRSADAPTAGDARPALLLEAAQEFHKAFLGADRDATVERLLREHPDSAAARAANDWKQRTGL